MVVLVTSTTAPSFSPFRLIIVITSGFILHNYVSTLSPSFTKVEHFLLQMLILITSENMPSLWNVTTLKTAAMQISRFCHYPTSDLFNIILLLLRIQSSDICRINIGKMGITTRVIRMYGKPRKDLNGYPHKHVSLTRRELRSRDSQPTRIYSSPSLYVNTAVYKDCNFAAFLWGRNTDVEAGSLDIAGLVIRKYHFI